MSRYATAPCSSAAAAMRRASKPLSATTLLAGDEVRMAGSAWSPSITGIARSSSTRSGRYRAASSTASAPSPASATTSNRPVASNRSRTRERRAPVSSAMRTLDETRQGGHDGRPFGLTVARRRTSARH